ncbi:flavin-containing monooxygenase 5-like [Brachionichthys hirsutus]|uniref:flavin-containing monooxygenase 5-like n=1 Tax=Brachionichthys hirsutus TaxID=412623 RepID=UPI003604A65A
MMCFSDFPIPGHFPNYMHNSLVIDYFRMYADNFQLTRHIRFNTKVLQVKQRSDFSHSGQWDVETENKDGKKEKHIFDAVMICIGHHCNPNMPLQDFPGINTFKGKYFHSRDYKTPEEWRDKKAVVIGIGNSGGDISVELSRVTKQVYLSTRRGAWILNRVGGNGLPIDFSFNRLTNTARLFLPFDVFCGLGERQLNQRFDHALYNLKPKHRLFSQHPTVNDDLPNRILSGTIQVKPNIHRFQGSSVEFEDGSVVEDVDLVVFATGYSFSYPFLASHVVSVSENKASLYKYVFPPELARPTLAIIGLVQPLGAIMPISEMQARWATRVFKGCLKLPPMSSMLKDIQCKKQTMAERYVTSRRHTIQVDYVSYMDEIAELVGVQPNISRLLLTDPRLGLKVMLGPCTPYQYRLRGPGKWAGARQAILTQLERVAQPMQTRPSDEPKPKRSFMRPLVLMLAALGLAAYLNKNQLLAFLQDPTTLLDKIRAYLPVQP